MKNPLEGKIKDGGKCLCDICGKISKMGGFFDPHSKDPIVACYNCMMKISAKQRGISVAEAKKLREKMFSTSRLYNQLKLEEYLKYFGKDAFDNIDELNMVTGYIMNVWNTFDKAAIDEFDKKGEEELRQIFGNINMNYRYLNKMTKTGRNDPCPCGSGKKYKKCCLLHDELEDALVAEWKKSDTSVIRKGMNLIDNSNILDIKLLIDHFWGEKRLDQAREKGAAATDELEFNEWLMNDYYLMNENTPYILGRLLADESLTGQERTIVEARIKAPKTVWLVTFIKKGRGALFRNIFDQEEKFVYDKLFSESARDSILVPARILNVGAYNLLSGAYVPYSLSNSQDIREIIIDEKNKCINDENINIFLRQNGYIFGRLDEKIKEKEVNARTNS